MEKTKITIIINSKYYVEEISPIKKFHVYNSTTFFLSKKNLHSLNNYRNYFHKYLLLCLTPGKWNK